MTDSKANLTYALAALKAALEAGADNLTLCDTNGGCLPDEISRLTREVRQALPRVSLGIHVHNDSHCAVANSLAAVAEGVELVQGCWNGYGERCGNANLASIIADLKLKMGIDCITRSPVAKSLNETSRYMDELANVVPQDSMPYVGNSAFAHKGGVHVFMVARSASYEHIDPSCWFETVARILISELSGKANVGREGRRTEFKFDKDLEAVDKILALVKQKEKQRLSIRRRGRLVRFARGRSAWERSRGFFGLDSFRVTVEKHGRRRDVRRGDAARSA